MEFQENKEIISENEEKGATMVEYVLMLALIAVVCIVAIQGLGNTTKNTFTYVSNQMTAATN